RSKLQEYGPKLQEYGSKLQEYRSKLQECRSKLQEYGSKLQECKPELQECGSKLQECNHKANHIPQNGNRRVQSREYFIDKERRNKNEIQKYIRNQLKDDYISDQLTLFEYDPFMGQRNKKR